MFFVDSYAKSDDKSPVIVQAYKTKSGAEKAAKKRRMAWPRVEIVEAADCENQFSHSLSLQ